MENRIKELEQELTSLPLMKPKFILSSFPGNLERAFFNEHLKYSLWYIRFILGLAILLYAGFGILDIWMMPDTKQVSWIIRFAFVCPSILFCFISTFFNYFKKVIYPLMFLITLVMAAGILGMIAVAGESEPASAFYFTGLILVIIVLNTGPYIRFRYAIIAGILIIIMYQGAAVFFSKLLLSPQNRAIFLNNNFFLVSAEALAVIGCFFNEYNMRHNFLLKRRIRYEEELNRAKAIKSWKDAYEIYNDIGSDLILKGYDQKSKEIKTIKNTVEKYIQKMKAKQVSSVIFNLIHEISQDNDIVSLFDTIIAMVFENCGITRACIVLRKEGSEDLEVMVQKNIKEDSMNEIMSIITTVMQSEVAVTSILTEENQNLFCFPVRFQGVIIAACYLDNLNSDSSLTRESMEMVQFLVTQVFLSFGNIPWSDKYLEIIINEKHLNEACDKYQISKREKEILLLVIKGLSNKTICEKEVITINTLRTHLKNLYSKSYTESREDLIQTFARYELE